MLFFDFDTDSVLNLKTVENLENLIFAVFLVKNKQKKTIYIYLCLSDAVTPFETQKDSSTNISQYFCAGIGAK